MLNAANSHWYVLTSKPREQQRACDNFILQCYNTFLPKIAKVIKKDSYNNSASTIISQLLIYPARQASG
jgi:hypothetical protein